MVNDTDQDPESLGGDAHKRPARILQELIRFDTTNPPGNEYDCIEWIRSLLDQYGIDSELIAQDPERPNLLARISGGEGASFMLYGHIDVVPTTNQEWTHPPFEGIINDDYVWGRGALDMKGGVAMMIAAVLRTQEEGIDPAGDIVLCVLSDEEAGGDYGAGYLTEEHPEKFADVQYALGEFGGFSLDMWGERFYPIEVSEKQVVWLKTTYTGPAGHGSLPNDDDAVAEMAAALDALNETRLPMHITPAAEEMISTMAAHLPSPRDEELAGLLDSDLTDEVLQELGPDGLVFDAALHNTVNATVVQGGEKENVVPEQVEVTFDMRLLPGFDSADGIKELRAIIGDAGTIEVVREEPAVPDPDMKLFEMLAGILEDADPDGTPVPYLMFAGSDARHFAKLGIQTYGFIPMNLPEEFEFLERIHAADERIPVESVEFGADAIYEALRRYKG